MSPSACKKKTEVISVVCSLSLKQLPQDVKALEEKIIEVVNQAGREFYGAIFAAYQQQWLDQRRREYRAERWREIDQVTPFGLIRLPVRVVRCRGDGHYLTLSRLLRPKATRLLSPWVEKRALEAATGKLRWEFKLITPPLAGLLSTAGGLVFGGAEEGNFFALDAETGKLLWELQLGGAIRANPMSFAIDGKQQVAISAGSSLFVFGLP